MGKGGKAGGGGKRGAPAAARDKGGAREWKPGDPPEVIDRAIVRAHRELSRGENLHNFITEGVGSRTNGDIVPIYQIRELVAKKLGTAAASHDYFDRRIVEISRSSNASSKFKMLTVNIGLNIKEHHREAGVGYVSFKSGQQYGFFYLERRRVDNPKKK